MIWKKIGTLRAYSETNGNARETRLPVQNYGHQVREVQYCLKIRSVSGPDAQ